MNLGFSCPGKKGNTVYGTAALLRKMTVDLDTAKKVQEVMDNETKETKTSNKVQQTLLKTPPERLLYENEKYPAVTVYC